MLIVVVEPRLGEFELGVVVVEVKFQMFRLIFGDVLGRLEANSKFCVFEISVNVHPYFETSPAVHSQDSEIFDHFRSRGTLCGYNLTW